MTARIVYLIIALLFALFASFQWNDPDSLPWIGVYLAVAGLFLGAFWGRRSLGITLGAVVLLLGGMAYYAGGAYEFITNEDGISFAQGMQNDYSYIEEAREFGGLTIAFLAVLFLLLQGRRWKR